MAAYQQPPPDRELPVDAPIDQGETPVFTLGFYAKWSVVFFFLILSVLLGMIISKSIGQLPDIKILETYRPNESTQIFDRDGTLIANIHGDEDRVVVPLKQISPNIQRAVMAIEDNRFYEHNGIDPRGTIRAFAANLSADEHVQGGSTVTQQLVKNLFLTPEKSYTRKIAEAILALRVEKHYSKDKILEMYLNQVYFGNLSYGVEKAARRYFKKPAKRLTLAESALLAGLLKAPEGLSPYYYPQAARKRQLEVLTKMVEYGYITPKQREEAEAQEIVLNSRKARPSKHPYFIAHVIQELERRFGEDVVRRGGLRVYTTMDEKAQEAAEKAMYEAIKTAKGSGVTQGAMVAMDLETGEILSLVGGVDFEKNQFNAATQARRAVGSTFKPFVYLTGFRLEKITPKTPISDRPISYGNWSPHNWDGRYMGAMDIRKALTLSRNTPTVQIGMKVGLDEVIKTCQLAGIDPNHIDNNSSSLLGSSGVSPLELVTAYSTIARGGIFLQPTTIKRIEDNRGKMVKLESRTPKRVFEQDYVAALVDILIDAVEKGTGKNAILKDRRVAGKTGTTDQVRDIWFMGFTSDMVAGVWMGNPKNIPLHGVFSSNSAKAWHDFAEQYYKDHPTPPQPFFVASNEYAAKAGLVHLVDKDGVLEAKKKLAIEKLNEDEDAFGPEKPLDSDPQPGKKTAKASTETKKNTTASMPFNPETGEPAHNSPSGQRSQEPQVAAPAPANPALHESSDQKQQKFDNWEKTLDKVNDNLNE